MTAADKLVDELLVLKDVPLVGTVIVLLEVVIVYKPGFWITWGGVTSISVYMGVSITVPFDIIVLFPDEFVFGIG